jgi:hypothetical protein
LIHHQKMDTHTTPGDSAPPSDQPQQNSGAVLSVGESVEPLASPIPQPIPNPLRAGASAALETLYLLHAEHAEEGDLPKFPENLAAEIDVPLEPPPGTLEDGLGEFARQQAWTIVMATLTREQRIHIQEYADATAAIREHLADNPNAPPSELFPQIEQFMGNVPKYRRVLNSLPQETVDKIDEFFNAVITDIGMRIEIHIRRRQQCRSS